MKLKILYAYLLNSYGWKLCCEAGNRSNFQFKSFCMESTGAPYLDIREWKHGFGYF